MKNTALKSRINTCFLALTFAISALPSFASAQNNATPMPRAITPGMQEAEPLPNAVMAPPANGFPADFNGVWLLADMKLTSYPGGTNPPYTEMARKWIEDYRARFNPIEDDPQKFCRVKGMPWSMLILARDYPVEIVQTNNNISMFFELWDQWRHIRMNQTVFPDVRVPSFNGYSISHWEGQTLIVETIGLTANPYPDPYLRSEQARVTERWTRQTDPVYGDIIVDEILFEDPLIYTEPAKAKMVFRRAAEGTIVGGYSCADALWREYIEPKMNPALDPNNIEPTQH